MEGSRQIDPWEALKTSPLAATPSAYHAINAILQPKKGLSTTGPRVWAWLASIQNLPVEEVSPEALHTICLAMEYLWKHQKSLKQPGLTVFKLCFNVINALSRGLAIEADAFGSLVHRVYAHFKTFDSSCTKEWVIGGLHLYGILMRCSPDQFRFQEFSALYTKAKVLDAKTSTYVLRQLVRHSIQTRELLEFIFKEFALEEVIMILSKIPFGRLEACLSNGLPVDFFLKLGYSYSKNDLWSAAEDAFLYAFNLCSKTKIEQFNSVIGLYLKSSKRPLAFAWCQRLLGLGFDGKLFNLYVDLLPIALEIDVEVWKICLKKISDARFEQVKPILELDNVYGAEARQVYYMKNYRNAPYERLLKEAQIHKGNVFKLYQNVWSFALGKTVAIESFDITAFDEETASMLDSIRSLACDKLEYLDVTSDLVIEALNIAHNTLKELECKLRDLPSKEHNFLTDSLFTASIINHLKLLSRLYWRMGVYKPTREYLAQAAKICKSMWPGREACWKELEGLTEAVEAVANGSLDLSGLHLLLEEDESAAIAKIEAEKIRVSSPLVYSGINDEDIFSQCQLSFLHHSPSTFSRLVMRAIRRQSVSIDHALGLLALSSALSFIRKDQAERRETAKEIAIENWSEYVLEAGRDEQCISFAYDIDDSNLIMCNYETRLLIVMPVKNFAEVKGKIEAILEENKRTLFSHKGKDVDVSTAEFKRTWWKSRQAFDRGLAAIASEIDSSWLFLFKALFTRAGNEASVRKMSSALSGRFGIQNEQLAQVLLSIGGASPKASILESLLCLLGVQVEKRAKGILDLRSCFQSAAVEQNIFLDETDEVPGEIVLALDKHLHLIPWEVTTNLRQSRVYRQASFWHLWRQEELSDDEKENVAYILNPGGDLKGTERYFKEKLDGSWSGIVGRPPNEKEYLDSLISSRLFMYFGHGAGDLYCSRGKIRRLRLDHGQQAPPSFLIGCSSGKMKTLGPFCPEGTFLDYLHAGCPTILVNLWDVTDKDIDKFTDRMFEHLGIYGEDQRYDLGGAVALSRGSCVMSYINGASPAIYGLPYNWH